MYSKSERLEFFVQGSATEPYQISFWRIDENVNSSCTCIAGKNGLACKHRLNLLDGDVTNLISSSTDGFQKLKLMLEGSDIGAAIRALDSAIISNYSLEKLLLLKPLERRKSVAPEILAESVIKGGLIKGNTCYYDVFSADLNYIGSVKVRRGTVFSETISDYFSGLSLTVKRLTDKLVWDKSQSIYAATAGSSISLTLEGRIEKTIQQKNLKRALIE